MSKFNVGDKVKYIGKDHKEMPVFYPKIGTIGTVVEEIGNTNWYIQWPKGSTSKKDRWYCDENDIELVENEDMTNEEIWKMLRPKFNKNNLEGNYVRIDRYGYIKEDVYNAIALAYRSGYERALKGRPFKIGEKKKKGRHWEPVDPNNLPKEGTRVRYSRESISYKNEPEFIKLGEIGKFKLGKYTELPGIEFDDGRFWDWVCFSNEIDCLDMWVEDDE